MDMLKKAFGLVANEADYTGSMQKEYEPRSKTTEHALNQLKRTAESLGIALGSVVLPAVTSVARGAATMIRPVMWLAETFPNVKNFAFGTAAALVTLKVVALGAAYAGTILSDGWGIARGAMHFMRPTILLQNALLVKQRVAAFGAAFGAKVLTVGMGALNLVMANNPMGWLVKGIMAASAGLVYLYNTCEPVRTALDELWAKMSWVSDGWNYLFGDDEKTIEIEAKAITEAKAKSTTATDIPTVARGAVAQPIVAGMPDMYGSASASPDFAQMADVTNTPSIPMPQPYGAAPVISPQINLSITMNGVPSQDVGDLLVQGIKSKEAALQSYFAELLNRITAEQGRLSYGS